MGSASSKNESVTEAFSKSVVETLNSSFISIAQTSVSSIIPTQTISIAVKSSSGAINIGGIQQKVVANIDVQKFLTQVSETQLSAMLESSIEASAKENQAVENGLTIGASSADNSSSMSVRSENINRIVNSYSYSQLISDVQSILTAQTITISAESDSGAIDINGISQFVQVEILSKQVADVMTKTFSDIVSSSDVSATKVTDQTASSGLSSTAIIMIVIIVIIVILLGLIVYFKFFRGSSNVDVNVRQGRGVRIARKYHH
jgi:hydrogenase maturation factor